MRTLNDKKKKPQKNQKDKQKSVQKQNIRKTVKTSFKEDYRYEIQVLPHGESLTVTTLILQYIQLMKQENIQQKKLFTKFIITGVNAVQRAIKRCKNKFIVFIFFDPKFYDLYEELLINLISKRAPYIIMKPNEEQGKIKQKLGVKRLSCIFLEIYEMMPNHLDQFFKFTLSCRASIPTLYEASLPPATMQQTIVTKSL